MSRRVSASEQGQLQGASSSLQAITGMIGPTLFTQVFARAITDRGEEAQVPGAPFLVAALMLVLAGIIAWRVTRPEAARDPGAP
jgi:DHA1 family tetracycline resistance protein-like MFS transporter